MSTDLHVHLLLIVSVLVAFIGPTFAVTVPCVPDSSLVSEEWRSLIDFPKNENNCGFDGPNGTVPPDHCKDFGSFGESQSGTLFKDPCNPNTTIDEIEVTVGLVGSSSMIRSIQTTYRCNKHVYLEAFPFVHHYYLVSSIVMDQYIHMVNLQTIRIL